MGNMGQPMAARLARAGVPLVVWSRRPHTCDPLADLGARVVETRDDVFARSSVVLLMLANATAMDAVLERGTPRFGQLVRDRTIIHMGTTAPEYSEGVATDVIAAGGRDA